MEVNTEDELSIEDSGVGLDTESSGARLVSLDVKKKIFAIADAHPNWTIKSLQQRGCAALQNRTQLHL